MPFNPPVLTGGPILTQNSRGGAPGEYQGVLQSIKTATSLPRCEVTTQGPGFAS